MSSVPDVQNDVELVFDMLAKNPLSDGDTETSEYLEFIYEKNNKDGHRLVIYNPITEEETILIQEKQDGKH